MIGLIVWLAIDINDKAKEGENTIVVSATGEVFSAPDLALTSFTVVTEAKTVSEAMAENTEKMNAVIAFAKEEGISDKDLKTTGFNIYPRYEWLQEWQCAVPCPGGKRVLAGYEVRQSLQIKIRELAKTGQIIQGAADRGVNQMDSLRFTIDDEDSLKEEARKQAIEKAKAKAKELASQLGVGLGKVVQFNESGIYPYYYTMEEAALGKGGGEDLQIEPGENKISSTVTIIYQIH